MIRTIVIWVVVIALIAAYAWFGYRHYTHLYRPNSKWAGKF